MLFVCIEREFFFSFLKTPGGYFVSHIEFSFHWRRAHDETVPCQCRRHFKRFSWPFKFYFTKLFFNCCKTTKTKNNVNKIKENKERKKKKKKNSFIQTDDDNNGDNCYSSVQEISGFLLQKFFSALFFFSSSFFFIVFF